MFFAADVISFRSYVDSATRFIRFVRYNSLFANSVTFVNVRFAVLRTFCTAKACGFKFFLIFFLRCKTT